MLERGVLLPPSPFEAWFLSLAHDAEIGRSTQPRVRPLGRASRRRDAMASSRPLPARLPREPVDATPVWFMRQAGRSLPEYRAHPRDARRWREIVGDAALCAEVTLQPVRPPRRGRRDPLRRHHDAAARGSASASELVDGVGPVIDAPDPDRSPTSTRLRAFEPARVGRHRCSRRSACCGASSTGPLIGFAGAPFTLASYLIGRRASREALRTHEGHAARRAGAGRALLEQLIDMTIALPAGAGRGRRPGAPGVRFVGRRARPARLRSVGRAAHAPAVRGPRRSASRSSISGRERRAARRRWREPAAT